MGSMNRIKITFLLLSWLAVFPPFSSAKEKISPDVQLLERAIQSLGGYGRYQRLETVSYEFDEASGAGAQAVSMSGRHFLKLHDGLGLRGREEIDFPGGKVVTIFTSSGTWRWENGKAVTDPEALKRAGDQFRQRVFWLLLPHNLKESGAPIRYAGLGYLDGKLTKRLDVSLDKMEFLPQPSDFTLYVDTDTHVPFGATFDPGRQKRPLTISFESYAANPNSIAVAGRRVLRDANGTRAGAFRLHRLSLNILVDESLVQPPAARP